LNPTEKILFLIKKRSFLNQIIHAKRENLRCYFIVFYTKKQLKFTPKRYRLFFSFFKKKGASRGGCPWR
jgi:hypothetical protein